MDNKKETDYKKVPWYAKRRAIAWIILIAILVAVFAIAIAQRI